MERMDEYRMARRVLIERKASLGLGRGRPKLDLSWMDGVKVALGNREMTVKAARQYAKIGESWRLVTITFSKWWWRQQFNTETAASRGNC